MSELSETYGPPLPEKLRSTWELFLDIVDKYPDNLGLVCAHQTHNLFGIPSQPLDDDKYLQKPYLRWTYKHLRGGIARCAGSLRQAGVKPGSPIFTFMANGAEYLLTRWAAAELGCVIIPMNPRNLANGEEVTYMVKIAMSVTPGKRSAVIVDDKNLAKTVDDLGLFTDSIKIITLGLEESDSWIQFENLMCQSGLQVKKEADDFANKVIDGIVLFTSGTTSLPKGCLKQFPMHACVMEAAIMQSSVQDALTPESSFAAVLPNNHAMGELVILLAATAGATVIYPGPTFQADRMLETMHREKVTQNQFLPVYIVMFRTALVPTMVHALLGLKKSKGIQLDHLASIMFGGSVLTPDNLQRCLNDLGAKGAETLYGMTEGDIIRPFSQRDLSQLVDGDDVTIGSVQPGAAIRIADPETNKPVPRNTVGELQSSSLQTSYYIGGVSKDTYYEDADGRLWLKSGDQARMDDQGRVFVTGRYKDMIIRGGENISPSAIEAAINKDLGLVALDPQVVGVGDRIAGEVPVVVVLGNVDEDTQEAVRNAILNNMGALFVPEDVVSVQDLGLADHPRTMAGKIQKTKLAALVKRYRTDLSNRSAATETSQLAAEVRRIWARAIGLDPSRLPLETPIGEFADSITVMRVRDMVTRKIGKSLPLLDMVNAGTVSRHINLLANTSAVDAEAEYKRPIRDGPPLLDDISHLREDKNLFEPTKELVLKTIALYGFGWNDVEDIIPTYDFNNVMTENGVFDSCGFKFAIFSKNAKKIQLGKALEAMLKNNRILASFLVRDEVRLKSNTSLHVAMRHDSKLFNFIIEDGGKLKSIQGLRDKASNRNQPPAVPGPLTRAVLYDIEETDTAGMILSVHHAVIDASSVQMFSEDLDRALGGQSQLSEHLDYKPWADSYHKLRTSPEAIAATNWHVKRLKGLEIHKKALWPEFNMPQNESDSIVEGNGEHDVQHMFDAPSIQELRREYPSVTAAIIIKTAVALLNIYRTRHTHALFSSLEAARTIFPFIPETPAVTGQLEATDVSGPTFQAVINFVEINPDETVLSLLERMQTDQLNLTKYTSAPFSEIMSALGPGSGDMLPKVFGHQIFNWLPGMATSGTNPYNNFEVISTVMRPRIGFALNAGMGGPHSNTVFLQLKGVSFDLDEYRKIAMELERITLWLVAKENWRRPVGGFINVIE